MQISDIFLETTVKEATARIYQYAKLIDQDHLSQKAHDFFSNLPQLFCYIFGFEGQLGWMDQVYSKYLDIERKKAFKKFEVESAEAEINALVELLSPNPGKQGINLFTLIIENYSQTKYYFKYANLPQHTQNLLQSRSTDDHIVHQYFTLFEDAFYRRDRQIASDPAVDCFDFYLLCFVFSLKKMQTLHSDSKSAQECVQDNFFDGLCKNPYLILLRRYLDYFSTDGSEINIRRKGMKKLLFLLQDYTINEVVYGGSGGAGSLSRLPGLSGYPHQDYRYEANFPQIPQPHVFYAITLFIHYINKLINPIEDHPNNYVVPFLKIGVYEARGYYSKLLYNFFLRCLKYWNRDMNNRSTLADFGIAWMAFMKPWEAHVENLIDDLSRFDYSGRISQISPYAPFSLSKPSLMILMSKDYLQYVNQFILRNILFYTCLLREFLIVLSELNNVSIKDIFFLRELLNFFSFHRDENGTQTLLYGHLRVDFLKQLSMGRNPRVDPGGIVSQHIQEMNADYADLYFLEDESLKARVEKMINRLENFKISFVRSKSNYQNEFGGVFKQLDDTMADIKARCFAIFDIDPRLQYSNYNYEFNKKASIPQRGIVGQFRYNPSEYKKNVWLRPVSPSEFEFTYRLFYELAKFIDAVVWNLDTRDPSYREKYNPTLNIRFFAKRYVVYIFAVLMFIILLRW